MTLATPHDKCGWCHKDKKVYWDFHHPFVFGPQGTFTGWIKLCIRCKIKLAKSYRREFFVRYVR